MLARYTSATGKLNGIMDMLSVNEALQRILSYVDALSPEKVPIADAAGRILAQDVLAPLDLPPFANSAMDGYAVRADDVQQVPTVLQVVEDIPAGHAPQVTVQSGQAARIMTGAPLPPGADAVVPLELTSLQQTELEAPSDVRIEQPVQKSAYVRFPGEDIQKGEVVLSTGRRLRPADVGMLASLGYLDVMVFRRPYVAVLSTGDELLRPDQPLVPGKIRESNSFVLASMLSKLGAVPVQLGIAQDTEVDVRRHLMTALDKEVDLIISSAGVSVGAFDVVKTVLDEIGRVAFWKVNMRPGKPLTFGQVDKVLFVGLPGNPVSSMVTFMVFVRPILAKMQGHDAGMKTWRVRLGEDMSSDGRMTFVRVRLEPDGSDLVAYSTGTQSSGALSSMIRADGLLIIPAGTYEVTQGHYLEFWPLDDFL